MLVVGGPLLLVTAASAYVAVDSLVTLIVIRLLAGVGEGLVFVGGASVIADLAPAARRGEAMSYFTLASNGGLALGPLLGEFVLSGDRYDAVWLTAAAIAGSAAVLALAVPETQPEQQEVPAERLIHRTALGPGLVLLCALIGVGGFNAFIALYAIELGLGGGGIVFLEFGVIVVAVRLFGARIPDLLGPAKCGRVALALIALGFTIMGVWQEPAGLLTATAFMALGQSLVYPALITYVVTHVPAAERSSAIGTFSAFVHLAIAAGAAALGSSFLSRATAARSSQRR